jgi:putative ABC transport system substrate-binding protein
MRRVLSAIALIIVALTVDLSTAAAQQPGRIYKIGFLILGTPDFVFPPLEVCTGPCLAMRDTLREKGYVRGTNVVIERRHAHGEVARLATEAEALVASNVDVIVTGGTAPTVAAMQATKRIPIVFNGVGAPVEKGVVASLAHPGRNVTGMAVSTAPVKTWQLLKELAPATKQGGGLIYLPNLPGGGAEYWPKLRSELRTVATAAGMEFVDMGVNGREEIETRFAEVGRAGNAGVIIHTDSMLFSWRAFIMEAALRHRLPTVCGQWPGWGPAGCAVTYAEDEDARNRGVAAQIAKVLNGVKPADIPVEQQARFRLIVNAKTAKTLGLTLPPSMLAMADEVIE